MRSKILELQSSRNVDCAVEFGNSRILECVLKFFNSTIVEFWNFRICAEFKNCRIKVF